MTVTPLTGPEKSKEELDGLGLFASILGHIGDGNFHSSIMYDRHDSVERGRVQKVVYDMVDRALEMEGSCTVSPRPYLRNTTDYRKGRTRSWPRQEGIFENRAWARHHRCHA